MSFRPKASNFLKWIDEIGTVEVGKLVGVHRVTVGQWRNRKVHPRAAQMRTIQKVTEGRVTYKDMIELPLRKGMR